MKKSKKFLFLSISIIYSVGICVPFITSCSNSNKINIGDQNGTPPTEINPPSYGKPNENDIETKSISEISTKIIQKAIIGNTFCNSNDGGQDIINVIFKNGSKHNVNIELNNNYNSNVFGNLGFKNPTVSFDILNHSNDFTLNNNKIISNSEIDPSNLKSINFDMVVSISETGYKTQTRNFKINLLNTYSSNDSDEYIKGMDYFVIDGKDETKPENWVVNPFTKNAEIIEKWGTIALPMKEEITKSDLFDLFYRAIENDYMFEMSFGKRKIKNNFFIDAYVEWLMQNWKYFPWLSFQNSPISFKGDKSLTWEDLYFNKDNLEEFFDKNETIMKSTKLFNQAENITVNSSFRQDFIYGLSVFFSNYLRPGMSELDKILAVFQFVSVWINYGGPANYAYSVWSKNEGICAHYSWITSQLLNMLGISSIPTVSAWLGRDESNFAPDYPLKGVQEHAVTWVYFDPNGGHDKKWYLIDVTWGDINQKGVTAPNITYSLGSSKWAGFLEPINDKEWGTNFNYLPQQNTYFQFWFGTWTTPFKNKEVMIASKEENYKKNWGTYNNIVTGFGDGGSTLMSRPAFNNGKWYSLVKFKGKNESILYETSMNSNEAKKIDIPSQFYKYLRPNSYSNPGLAQYRNWTIMINNEIVPQEYDADDWRLKDRTLVFHNLDDTKWEDSFTWQLPNDVLYVKNGVEWKANRANIQTYYIDNDKLVVHYETNEWGNKTQTKVEYPLSKIEQETNKKISIENDKYLTSGDVDMYKTFYQYLGNTHKFGNNNNEVTHEEKKIYNKFFTDFTNTGDNYKDIKRMSDYYENFEKSLIKNNNFLQSNIINDLYSIDLDNFKKYGYFVDFNAGYDSFDKLSNDEYDSNVKYDVYFSEQKNGDYKKIAENLEKINLEYKMFSQNGLNPNGYLYFEEKYQNGNKVTSKVFSFRTDIENLPNPYSSTKVSKVDDGVFFNTSNYTNFIRKEPYWSREQWGIDIDLTTIDDPNYSFDIILKSYKFNTRKIENIFTKENAVGRNKESIYLGLINDNNKGIYFLELKVKSKKDPSVSFSLYSKLLYFLSYDDIKNDNFIEWTNLSLELKKAIN